MTQIILQDKPELRRPILVAGFAGWSDAGHAATLAIQQLASALSATKFAEIDPDEFYDFTASRPWVRIEQDGQREMSWPVNTFLAHRGPHDGLDVILYLGTEPGLRWRTFIQNVVGLARDFDVSMVVTFGAHHAQMSHKEAVPIAGWAWPTALNEKLGVLGVNQIAYEGPTGIVTALACALADAKIPVAALWAAVPVYLGTTANPKAALALMKRLDQACGLGLALGDLAKASAQFEHSVNLAIRHARTMPGVSLFQPSADEIDATSQEDAANSDTTREIATELPSADEMIRGAEEFLRQSRGS